MTERQPPLAAPAARRIGKRVADLQDQTLERRLRRSDDERLAAIYKREAASAPGRVARRPWLRRSVALLAAAALALVAIVLVRGRDEALSYEIAGASGAIGHWVAADTASIPLAFSDGSLVTVEPGGRARVTALGKRRADLLLEQGTLHVRVVHREGNAWVVASGPFLVHVVGTEFDVGWDTAQDTLSIRMDAGRVRVEGPCVEAGGRYLSAPESLRLTCNEAPADPSAPVATAVAPPPSEVVTPAPAGTPSAAAAPALPAWRTKLQAGLLREAFAAAEDLGLEAVITSATGAELNELGSAARLAGKGAVAAQLYGAARARAPGTDAAANAAYQLGRMAFDGRSAWTEAERWFATYLAERPGGPLAPEALGRSMECARSRGDGARARELASRYLERYPKGAHAAVASEIVEGSP